MSREIKQEGEFRYIEEGEGEVLLLLHGLFGALSNFSDLIDHFKTKYKVVIPVLPLYEMELKETTVMSLVRFTERFIAKKGYEGVNLLGNSLGGHVAQLYALENLSNVKSVTLTGSSGLFESAMGDTFPKRGSYEYIEKKTQETFYDPNTATKELVDEVFEIVNNNEKVLRVLSMARSALKQNLAEKLGNLNKPVLLIWGKQDAITPPFVGEEFHKLIPNSALHFIDKAGHAPMMEKPNEFNEILDEFLYSIYHEN